MSYSILQSNLDVPKVDQLKRAFRSVSCLTDIDAQTMARDAYGILVKGLSAEDAARVQGALKVEGVETTILSDQALPALPPSKQVHRLDCAEAGLTIYDPLGRGFVLEWHHIMMIAAGEVSLSEFKRVEKQTPQFGFTPRGYAGVQKKSEFSTREERSHHLLLEIILNRALLRYSADAAHFNYQYLGDRRGGDLLSNFALLVQDLIHFATNATVNRGACALRDNPAEPFDYPSKNAFFEEIIWLLWRSQT